MPFESKAQQGYMYANPEILGKDKLKEWSLKTNFKTLPKHKGKKTLKHKRKFNIMD